VVGCEIDGDLRARVAGAHHQHAPFLDWGGVTVLLRVELDDALVELARERRNPGVGIGTSRYDRVRSEQRVLTADHLEAIPDLRQSVDVDPCPDRELELAGISFQIVGGLVLGRIRGGRSRKRHSR
jgi:hypothetical protein